MTFRHLLAGALGWAVGLGIALLRATPGAIVKVKRVDEIVAKMSPSERDAIVGEIKTVIDNYDRSSNAPYPLALHDFAEKLKAYEQR